MEQGFEDSSSVPSLGSSSISSVTTASTSGGNAWTIPQKADAYHASTDASLFSSSLPVLPHEKLNLNDLEHSGQSLDDNSTDLNKLHQDNEIKDSLEDVEPIAIGSMLPGDEEELLAGIMDDFDLRGLPSQLEDLEDDLFDSGGGMEMDFDTQVSLSTGMSYLNISNSVPTNGIIQYATSSSGGTVSGEHPYGEHPSRTLFVRNINSNVEDSELKALFEQYGDIRTLYTACKHRGFVMISYYDIRAARTAMRALQNKPLRRRKLDIHFSIPKDNPSEKDINQGTLVVFNLDPSVSNDELLQIFGAYGEVKEIRETPHKRHHKFIEFYDVRAAEAALKALNRIDIAGKRIKLEPSRPGGARRNLMQQLSQDLDQDDTHSFHHHVGSPAFNSPPGNWLQFGSPTNRNSLHAFGKSPVLGSGSPMQNNHLPGLASILPSQVSNPVKMGPIGKDQGRSNFMNQIFTNTGSSQGSPFRSSSFPEQKLGTSPGPISPVESKTNSSTLGRLSGPQFLWGSPSYSGNASSALPTASTGHSFTSSRQGIGFGYPNRHSSFLAAHNNYHHVGSAPSGVPLERHLGFYPESPETSFLNPVAFGGASLGQGNGNYMVGTSSRSNAGLHMSMTENGSPSFRTMPLPRHSPLFLGNGSYPGPGLAGNEIMAERMHARRVDNTATQVDMKKQYQLDLDKIISGEDPRTTLMIKNIPNKYTSKMLLAAIDESHHGTYDFLYLPIDFKNKCNVGYAFINMLSPSHIISFYQAFNGKRWEKFNSEKVASLAYARIQGKAALVAHFQNSSLMNEDKRCRPIVFHTEKEETGAQEALRSSNLNVCIRQADGSYSGDVLESPKEDSDEKSEKSEAVH